MKLSTRIIKKVNPVFLWKPDGSYGNDILDAGHTIVLMVDHRTVLKTKSLIEADAMHDRLLADGNKLLPMRECPVVNPSEIIMHYTSTTYKDWCNL